MITIVIKQEAINLPVLCKELKAEGFEVRIINANSIRNSYIEDEDETVYSASSLFFDSIKKNAVKCLKCGDEIESLFTEHSVRCSCGRCHIDGGHTKLIRNITGKYRELSCYYLPTT